MANKNWIKLILFVGVPLLAGAIGSYFTIPAVQGWYGTLLRPDIAPPNWLFGPVWTTLYILMGLAMFLVWKNRHNNSSYPIANKLFFVQLILNVLWSAIFFGARNLGGALIEILVLWMVILFTIISFSHFSKVAIYLMLPYILWVSFAAYLNWSFWILN